MDHFNLKRVFSLTPAGTMGMSDREVEAGTFDKPGMMGMGSMDMGGMHGMESMDHGADAASKKMEGMDHRPPADAGDTSHDAGMQMEHPTSPTKGMDSRPLHANTFSVFTER